MQAELIVFVVDDDLAIRDSLLTFFPSNSLRVSVFASLVDYLNQFDPNSLGCLLLDVSVLGIQGLNISRSLAAPQTKFSILIITAYSDSPFSLATMPAGTVDLVNKPFDENELLRRVRDAIRRDTEARELESQRSAFEQWLQTLTKRENEVLERVIKGEPTKRIAAQLWSSIHTVRNQRAAILKKLNADSAVDLTRRVSSLEIL